MIYMEHGRFYTGEGPSDPESRPCSIPYIGGGPVRRRGKRKGDPGGWFGGEESVGRLWFSSPHRDEGPTVFYEGVLYTAEDPPPGETEAVLRPMDLLASTPLEPSAEWVGMFTDPDGKKVSVSWSRTYNTSGGRGKKGHSPSKSRSSFPAAEAEAYAKGFAEGAQLDVTDMSFEDLKGDCAKITARRILDSASSLEDLISPEERARLQEQTSYLPPSEQKRTLTQAYRAAAAAEAARRGEEETAGWSREQCEGFINAHPREAGEVRSEDMNIVKEATRFGTWMHSRMNAVLTAGSSPAPPVAEWAESGDAVENAFRGFLRDKGIEEIYSEIPMINEESGDGRPWVGTADAIGREGDDYVVVDWKTTSAKPTRRPPDYQRCQAAIYATSGLWAPDGHTLAEAPKMAKAYVVTADREGNLYVDEIEANRFEPWLDYANKELRDKAEDKRRLEELYSED